MTVQDAGKIAVIGCGMIGPDICASVLLAGLPVTMIGRSEKSIQKGVRNLKADLDDYLQSGIIGPEEKAEMIKRVSTTVSLEEGVREADFIFEAVTEDLEVKQTLFSQIETACSDRAVLCSSTSGLSPDAMAGDMKRLKRLMVTHFWNPSHLVPLVEVIHQQGIDSDAAERASQLLELLGKVPVVLKKDIAGHIGNRLQHALFREALYLIEEGVADPADIDKVVLHSFGPRFSTIGPMEYYDSCGLDLQLKVEGYLFQELCRATAPQKVLTDRIAAGDLGQKNGRGLFDWSVRDGDDFRRRRNQRFVEYVKRRAVE